MQFQQLLGASLLLAGHVIATSHASMASNSSMSSGSSSGSSGSSSRSSSAPSSASSMASPMASSSGSQVVHVIQVGSEDITDTKFYPNNVQANVGDMVQFQFWPKNHSVAQSTFDQPCVPIQNVMPNKTDAFFSGFMPNNRSASASMNEVMTFTIPVTSKAPIWFYCSQGMHCQKGMVGAINAATSGEKTVEAFAQKAQGASQNLTPGQSGSGSSSGSSSGSGSGSNSGSNSGTSSSGSSGSGTTGGASGSGTASSPSSTISQVTGNTAAGRMAGSSVMALLCGVAAALLAL